MSRGLGLSKLEQERLKLVQSKLQEQLIGLLKEEENRYCADCDAKGPRWASWNLGIFLCIRCAGIHRNLGVHISKVKSVNLDSWTPEQVQSMRVIGNSTARGVYEANIPEHFRRPQSDSSMEAFIRAKYDAKRYIMKGWVKPPVNVGDLPCWEEIQDIKCGGSGKKAHAAAAAKKAKALGSAPLPASAKAAQPIQKPNQAAAPAQPPAPPKKESAMDDLLGLSAPPPVAAAAIPPSASAPVVDLLGLNSAPQPPPPVAAQTAPSQQPNPPPAPAPTNEALLLEASVASAAATPSAAGPKSNTDILALFGSGASSTATSPMNNLPPMGAPPQAAGFGPIVAAPQPQQAMFPGQQHQHFPAAWPQTNHAAPASFPNLFSAQPQPNPVFGAFVAPANPGFPQHHQPAAQPQHHQQHQPTTNANAFAGLGQLGGLSLGGQSNTAASAANTLANNLWQ